MTLTACLAAEPDPWPTCPTGGLREWMAMRVALLNGAPDEAGQHAPIALREGITQAQLDALADWTGSDAFSPLQRAALGLCDTMTRQVHVPAATLQAVRTLLRERQTVELVATIAAEHMASCLLEALHIQASDAR